MSLCHQHSRRRHFCRCTESDRLTTARCHRIGLIALASDYVVERDFMNMRPGDEVAVFVSRVLNVNPCTVENLRTMGPRLADAASLIIPDGRLDAMVYCCTSGTAAMGYETVAENIRSVRPGIPVITPITAGLRALSQFSAEQIVVLTPILMTSMRLWLITSKNTDRGATTSYFANDNDMARFLRKRSSARRKRQTGMIRMHCLSPVRQLERSM